MASSFANQGTAKASCFDKLSMRNFRQGAKSPCPHESLILSLSKDEPPSLPKGLTA